MDLGPCYIYNFHMHSILTYKLSKQQFEEVYCIQNVMKYQLRFAITNVSIYRLQLFANLTYRNYVQQTYFFFMLVLGNYVFVPKG